MSLLRPIDFIGAAAMVGASIPGSDEQRSSRADRQTTVALVRITDRRKGVAAALGLLSFADMKSLNSEYEIRFAQNMIA